MAGRQSSSSRRVTTAAAALLLATPLWAQESKPIDPRLAAIHKVLVVAGDPLAADYAVARCLSDALPRQLPLTIVTVPTEADALLRITARLVDDDGPPQTGVRPKNHATITAVLPDNSTAWTETYYYGSASSPSNACGLADELVNQLRAAMKKARDQR